MSYKCAFVLLHKLREAMTEEMKGRTVGGDGKVVEADGGYFGGYAVVLTSQAATLGFADALVLPPFYYKGVADDGLFAVIGAIVGATTAQPIPIYLYHFPAQSGVPWHISLPPHRFLRRAHRRT